MQFSPWRSKAEAPSPESATIPKSQISIPAPAAGPTLAGTSKNPNLAVQAATGTSHGSFAGAAAPVADGKIAPLGSRDDRRTGWNMRMRSVGVLLFLVLLAAAPLQAQQARDTAVEISATTQTSPPAITLSWKALGYAYNTALDHSIHRRIPGADWGEPIATLNATAVSWTDTTVSTGTLYEYRVIRRIRNTNTTQDSIGVGYCWSGIDVPLVEQRGALVLVVDDQIASPLGYEISRLTQDLIGDGWRVRRLDVARTMTPPQIRSLIQAERVADPNVESVLLLGSIPVPYSGNMAPDGHTEHQGAWPADGYYGELDGVWTDTEVNNPDASDPRNRNIPGDGKFDQDSFPSSQSGVPGQVELQVGRVDLSDMTFFKVGTETTLQQEIRLLRRYLDRNHVWRQAGEPVPARALVDDHFGIVGLSAFSSSGWRNGSAMVGWTQNSALDWTNTLGTNAYLYAYGCGGGSWSSASGVGSCDSFAANGSRAVFTGLFGSYFGDWDRANSFLRGPLAAPGLGLTCVWDRGHWPQHPLGMGQTVGYTSKLTMNNRGIILDYFNWDTGKITHPQYYTSPPPPTPTDTFSALMGDPSLRLHPVPPPTGLVAAGSSNAVLQWTHAANQSDPNFLGYHVYRAPSLTGTFTRLTAGPITTNTWTDASPLANAVYQVRTVARTVGNTGSYTNSSQGAFCPWSVANSSNQAPVVSAAIVNPSPVTGVTGALAATASDDAGEPGLTYVWTVVSKPPYADAPSFTPNGANAAKTSTVTFSLAGNYTLRVTATDAGGMMASRDLSLTVNQTPTTLANITPTTVFVQPGATQAFTTAVSDQFSKAMTAAVTWTVSGGGSISSEGVFTAGAVPGGPYTVTASIIGATSKTAQVTVQNPANEPPTVTSATITPAPVTGTNGTVSAVATDDGGEPALKYSWTTVSKPVGANNAGFSPNNSNAAKTSKATFNRAGNYTLRVTTTDAGNLTTSRDLSLTVNQTTTMVTISPSSGTYRVRTTLGPGVAVRDQFAQIINSPSVTWTSNGGSLTGDGWFDLGSVPGNVTLTATSGLASSTATYVVEDFDFFVAWLETRGLSLTDAGTDTDGDGFANLLEYALGTEPQDPADGPPRPFAGITKVGDSEYLTLTYRLMTDWSITVRVEAADSVMGPWSSATEAVEQRWQVNIDDETGDNFITARDKKPVSTGNKRFMRLRVSQP